MNNVLTALLWAAIGASTVWLVTWPLRRRSITLLLLSLTLTCTAASVGAMLGAVHSMLVPMGNESAALLAAAAVGILTAVAAVAAARRLSKEHAILRAAVVEFAGGEAHPQVGPRLSRELQQVRDQLQATATELTESHERERALEHSRRELVAWMSHDLRTPLAGLRAMAEALEDGVPDDPATYYKQITATVHRLDGMVDDLFDLSRIQAGSLGRPSEPLYVDEVVGEVVDRMTALADAHGVDLRRAAFGAEVTVRGDAETLNRAVTNVVANAIRHTDVGGRVDVVVRCDGRGIAIDVDDECGGIDSDILPRVFDVGFRGASSRPTGARSGRAGLGLAITRGIVEAHSGTVTVMNTTRGCRFTVALPRLDEAAGNVVATGPASRP